VVGWRPPRTICPITFKILHTAEWTAELNRLGGSLYYVTGNLSWAHGVAPYEILWHTCNPGIGVWIHQTRKTQFEKKLWVFSIPNKYDWDVFYLQFEFNPIFHSVIPTTRHLQQHLMRSVLGLPKIWILHFETLVYKWSSGVLHCETLFTQKLTFTAKQ